MRCNFRNKKLDHSAFLSSLISLDKSNENPRRRKLRDISLAESLRFSRAERRYRSRAEVDTSRFAEVKHRNEITRK